MNTEGSYVPPRETGKGKTSRTQERLYRDACEAAEAVRQAKRTKFEPHLPLGKK